MVTCFLDCCSDPPEELDVAMDGWQTTGPAYQRYQFLDPSRDDEILAETLVDDALDDTITPELKFGYPPRDGEANPYGKLLNDTYRVTLVPDPWEGVSEDQVIEWFSNPVYREGTTPPGWPYRQVYRLADRHGGGKDHFYISAHGPGASAPYYVLVLRLRLDTEHHSAVLVIYRNEDLPEGDDAEVIRSLNGLSPNVIQSVFVQRMKRGDYGLTVRAASNEEPVEVELAGPADLTVEPFNEATVFAPQAGATVLVKHALGNTAANGEDRNVEQDESEPNKCTLYDESESPIAGNGAYRGGGIMKITEPVTTPMTAESINVSSVALEDPQENELVVEGGTPQTVPKRIEIEGIAGVRAKGCWDAYFVDDETAIRLRNSQGEVRLREITSWSTIGPKSGEVTDVTGGDDLVFNSETDELVVTLPEFSRWTFRDLFNPHLHEPMQRSALDTESSYAASIASTLDLTSAGISVSVEFSGSSDIITFTYDDPMATWPGDVNVLTEGPILVESEDHGLLVGEVVQWNDVPEGLTLLGTTIPADVFTSIPNHSTVQAVPDDDHFQVGLYMGPIDAVDGEEEPPFTWSLVKTVTGEISDFRRHEGAVLVVTEVDPPLRVGVHLHLAEDSTSDWNLIVKGRCEVVSVVALEGEEGLIGYTIDRVPPELPLIEVAEGANWRGSGQCGHSEWFGPEDYEPFFLTHYLGYADDGDGPSEYPPEVRGTMATVLVKLPV